METTYDRIKLMCSERNVTISELEEHVGLGKKTMYNWKTSTPSAENIQKVARALDCSTDYLLGNAPHPNAITPKYSFSTDMSASVIASANAETRTIMEDLEMLHKRPDLRVLLSAGSKLDKNGIAAVIAIVERMNGEANE